MTFSRRIYKLNSGENISLYQEEANTLEYFLFSNNMTSKHIITFSKTPTSTPAVRNLGYNHITKLNSSHSVFCHDNNISILGNDEYGI